jgi:hypothetical protein
LFQCTFVGSWKKDLACQIVIQGRAVITLLSKWNVMSKTLLDASGSVLTIHHSGYLSRIIIS